jgi:hypothetical protein
MGGYSIRNNSIQYYGLARVARRDVQTGSVHGIPCLKDVEESVCWIMEKPRAVKRGPRV